MEIENGRTEIRKLCGGLVHDTATPIATVRAMFLHLQKQTVSDETADLINKANKELQNITECINQFWLEIDKRIPEEKQEKE